MGLFRKAPINTARTHQRFSASYSGGRPAWMHAGLEIALIDGGHDDLEVVGESKYQDNLWRLVGPRLLPEVRERKEIYALLVPEDGNPYDANAVTVWIEGLKIGYLSRDDAQRYRAGLLALQEKHGQPIALPGVIAGGGIREDGPGRLGVFLRHNPEDFGLRPAYIAPEADARLRAALTDELANSKGCSYSLTWMHGLSPDDAHAIPTLRKALATETDPIGRYFIYAELEAALYRCRDVFASALDEYDEVCRQHDAEMDSIRQACMAQWGKVPVLGLYRQMAIRQQKLHDYRHALWWAERGLALYGNDAARPETVEDLQRRAASYQAKLGR